MGAVEGGWFESLDGIHWGWEVGDIFFLFFLRSFLAFLLANSDFFTEMGIRLSKPGGKRGPDIEDEEVGGILLFLERGSNLLKVVIGLRPWEGPCEDFSDEGFDLGLVGVGLFEPDRIWGFLGFKGDGPGVRL